MTHLAVFDWNCTLIDDFDANLIATNESLALFDRDPIDAETYRQNFSFPILHFYVAVGIKTDEYLSRHEEAARIWIACYEREALKARLRPGVVEFLQWLNAKDDVHCLLLSNYLQDNIAIQLRHYQIADFLDGVSGKRQYDASYISSMDKQTRLEDYMKTHGFTPEKTFIIGDSHEETELAHKMGITSFAITGGILNEERLRACSPDHLVHDFFEVERIVKGMWRD